MPHSFRNGSHPPNWLIAIAASAGGIPAIETVLMGLPPEIPAAVLAIMHLERRRTTSQLASIFGRSTRLGVSEARDGERLLSGHVYVGPPDYHLTVSGAETIALTHEDPVHFVRPAADVLFASAAVAFGKFSIAVILSGSGVDGAAGAAALHKAGGVVIAQDQATSQYFGMPQAAAELGPADYVLPLPEISIKLISLTSK